MKFFKYLGLLAIMIFSFYYTDKIATFLLEKNKLYQQIDTNKDKYKVESTSAVIENDYIIPGLKGKEVNVKTSYYNMKNIEKFNEYYLVYQDILPRVSIEENKDKIIRSGNEKKNSITFILEDDEKLIDYFVNNNYQANLLITLDNYDKLNTLEAINNDLNNYEKVESFLESKSINKDLCVINTQIEDLCRKHNKYLIEPTIVNNTNFLTVKNNLKSGSIFLIKKGTKLENIKLLIKDISFKDLNIVYLSDLITENSVK